MHAAWQIFPPRIWHAFYWGCNFPLFLCVGRVSEFRKFSSHTQRTAGSSICASGTMAALQKYLQSLLLLREKCVPVLICSGGGGDRRARFHSHRSPPLIRFLCLRPPSLSSPRKILQPRPICCSTKADRGTIQKCFNFSFLAQAWRGSRQANCLLLGMCCHHWGPPSAARSPFPSPQKLQEKADGAHDEDAVGGNAIAGTTQRRWLKCPSLFLRCSSAFEAADQAGLRIRGGVCRGAPRAGPDCPRLPRPLPGGDQRQPRVPGHRR